MLLLVDTHLQARGRITCVLQVTTALARVVFQFLALQELTTIIMAKVRHQTA
jgi:hypothetical protein